MKKGLELEFWVIDEDGYLTSAADIIDDNDDLVVQEFVEPLLEIKTEPYTDDATIRAKTKERLASVLASAEAAGKQIVPLATPLVTDDVDLIPSERGKIQQAVLGDHAQYAMNVAGTHIHYDQTDVGKQLKLLTALDPVIAALHSSPFYDGEQHGAGARTQIYRYRCYEDLPKHGQLWPYPDSRADWERKIKKRHEEFKERACAQGYSEATFEEYFTPSESVWTPIRVRDTFNTIEWRAPDISLPSQIFPFLEHVNTLVETVDQKTITKGNPAVDSESVTIPPFETVEERVQQSIEDGLDHPKIKSYCSSYGIDPDRFDPLTRELQTHDSLTHENGRMLRLEYAERLARDVDTL